MSVCVCVCVFVCVCLCVCVCVCVCVCSVNSAIAPNKPPKGTPYELAPYGKDF